MRSYEKTTELAEATQVAAQKTAADAESGKEKAKQEAKQEATVAIGAIHEALGQAKAAIETLPKTKTLQAARQRLPQ